VTRQLLRDQRVPLSSLHPDMRHRALETQHLLESHTTHRRSLLLRAGGPAHAAAPSRGSFYTALRALQGAKPWVSWNLRGLSDADFAAYSSIPAPPGARLNGVSVPGGEAGAGSPSATPEAEEEVQLSALLEGPLGCYRQHVDSGHHQQEGLAGPQLSSCVAMLAKVRACGGCVCGCVWLVVWFCVVVRVCLCV
jgi:hypothetical protein